jgi:predicted Zn-dependent protease
MDDRARLLLELARPDAQTLAARNNLIELEPVVQNHPDERHAGLAYAANLVKVGRAIEALPILKRLVEKHADDPAAWDTYLEALDASGDEAASSAALDGLPASIRDDPRMSLQRGRRAMRTQDLAKALAELTRAVKALPASTEAAHLLSEALRLRGRDQESRELARRVADARKAKDELKDVFQEALTTPSFASGALLDLFRRLAGLRERMLRPDEALAWHHLILHATPDDAESLAAVKRLEAQVKGR